jgi:hypothetical protein
MKILLLMVAVQSLHLHASAWFNREACIRILALRQQLNIYKRKSKKPVLRNRNRLFWSVLSKLWGDRTSELVLVKPETVIRWRKRKFREFWRRKSQDKPGKPAIPQKHIERLTGTLRRECLDRMLIWNERHLRCVLVEFIRWDDHGRVHQGLNEIPDPDPALTGAKPFSGKLVAIPVLNGLHHDYRLAA